MRISKRLLLPYIRWSIKNLSLLEWLFWSLSLSFGSFAATIAYLQAPTGHKTLFAAGTLLGTLKAARLPFTIGRRRAVKRALARQVKPPEEEPLLLTNPTLPNEQQPRSRHAGSSRAR